MISKWGSVKVEDIAEVRSGKRLPKGQVLISEPTAHPYIRLVDVDNGRVQSSNLQYLSVETRASIKRYVVNTDDICLAIVGHTIGMVFYIEDQWDDVNLTENAARITNLSSSFNPRFIYYYLTSPTGQQEIISRKVGSAQGKLPLYNIKSLEIPNIPRIIQDKVVGILDSLSLKYELNAETNQTLEEMAQAIFKSWFVDFDPVKAKMNGEQPEGMDAATASLFPEKLVESELGLIPDGWDVEPLDSIFTVNKGLSYKGNFLSDDKSDVPLINLGNFGGNGKFRYEKVKYYSGDYKPRHVVKPGQLVIANTDMTQDRVILGSAILVPELGGEEYLTTHHTFSTSFKKQYPEDVWKYFVFYSLQRPSFRFRAEGFATGTTVLAMPKDAFTFCTVALPPVELVEKFSALVQSLKQKIACNEKENVELTNLRDILLPKLLSGEIELSR